MDCVSLLQVEELVHLPIVPKYPGLPQSSQVSPASCHPGPSQILSVHLFYSLLKKREDKAQSASASASDHHLEALKDALRA